MKNILLLFFVLSCTELCSQTKRNPLICGFDYFLQHQRENNVPYMQAYEEVMRNWQTSAYQTRGGGGVYVLPVVFHIVYHNEQQNIADSVVYSQLEVLNEDYRRMNEDAMQTRDIFLPAAADCEIEFQLASVDPNGNLSTGITHTYTDETGFAFDLFSATNTLDAVKHSDEGGVDAWDPSHYINIWVCNIEAGFIGQIFGMSYPPTGLDNWPAGSSAPSLAEQGVLLHYTTVGRNNPFANDDGTADNNKGRTCTHELGHYLGLRHTWGDELFFDVCSEDDGMSDTPLCGSGDQYNCDYTANSCDEGQDDLPDMLENYMDYTRDECYNMFTNDQKSLMRYVIEELRPELLEGVGIGENYSANNSLHVYPNPTESFVNIKCAEEINQLNIYDLCGKSCLILSPGENIVMVDLPDLLLGLYMVEVYTKSDQRYTKRLFIN